MTANAITLVALFLFGWLYNHAVQWLERNGYEDGFTSLLVVGGTAVTLLGLAAIDPHAAMWAIACFAASGTPMVLGSIWRYLQRRKDQAAAAQQIVKEL